MSRLVFAALVLLLARPLAAQDLLLTNAHLVDPRTETVRPGVLLIRGDTLAAVLEATPRDFDGIVLDLNEGYVIPGLIDLHVHSYGNLSPSGVEALGAEAAARRMLYAGVTGFLDLFADEDAIFAFRDRQRLENLPAADVYAAGPLLTRPGGYGTQMGLSTRTVATPDEARRAVADLARRRPDVIKFAYLPESEAFVSMDRETMEALVQTADEAGLRTVAHVGSWEGVREVVEAGVSAVTHLPHDPIPEDVPALMRAHGTVVIPALAGAFGVLDLTTPRWRDNSLLAAVTSPDVLAVYRRPDTLEAALGAILHTRHAHREPTLASVPALHQAGVRVLAGTDAGVLGTIQGFSLHHELALLTEAGLSEWAALAAATTEAGAFLGERVGFRVGDRANFLVLNASPLDNISNTQAITHVVHRGRVVDREALLDDATASRPVAQALLDDFESGTLTSALGTTWRVYRDEVVGGTSTADVLVSGGVLRVEATIRPAPGGIGFIELALPLDESGAPRDVSAFDGVRVRLRVWRGILALKIQTAEVTNHDHPAVLLGPSEAVLDLMLPFPEFGPLWSPATPWTGRRVLGLALSAGGTEAGEVAYEIEEIAFYRETDSAVEIDPRP